MPMVALEGRSAVRRVGRVVATALLLAVTWLAHPASADVYPPGAVEMVQGRTSLATTPQGTLATFAGSGFAQGAVVRVAVDGTVKRSLRTNPRGDFSVSMPIEGPHSMTATGLGKAGRPRIVIATVTRAQLVRLTPLGDEDGPQGLYLAVLSGLSSIAVFAAGVVALRLLDRAALTR
jgi:hypothetical protein